MQCFTAMRGFSHKIVIIMNYEITRAMAHNILCDSVAT